MSTNYNDPVSKLLTYGGYDINHRTGEWPNYLSLGFSEQDVPELIRMITDTRLNHASQDSLKVWAPLHAWRTLGQLKAIDAVEPLVRLFDQLPNDDWLSSELPKVFSLIGVQSIPEIKNFLEDSKVEEFRRIGVPACLEKIAIHHPQCRDECIGILRDQLKQHASNGNSLNAFLILSLSKLDAKTTIEIIREAYASEHVDISVLGDVEDLEIDMGFRIARETPQPNYAWTREIAKLGSNKNLDTFRSNKSTNSIKNPMKHVGRNDPCPCGSGKKFKKCCLH